MKYAIFYFSPCGGTKAVADIISKELGDAPMQELTTPSMNTAIDRDTLTFFCIPVYGGRIPKPMYDRMKIITGDKTPCVPVAVYGNRAVDDALLEMSDLAAKCGFVTVAGCEIVAPHSIDPEFGAGRPDANDKAKIHRQRYVRLIVGDDARKAVVFGIGLGKLFKSELVRYAVGHFLAERNDFFSCHYVSPSIYIYVFYKSGLIS